MNLNPCPLIILETGCKSPINLISFFFFSVHKEFVVLISTVTACPQEHSTAYTTSDG